MSSTGSYLILIGPGCHAAVRLRTKITRGVGLAPSTRRWPTSWSKPQTRWRSVSASHLVALVRAGATLHQARFVAAGRPHPRPRLPGSSAAIDEVA